MGKINWGLHQLIFKGLDSTYTELKINKTWESGLFLDVLTIFTKAACTDRAFMSFGKGKWALSSVKEIINTRWICVISHPSFNWKARGED